MGNLAASTVPQLMLLVLCFVGLLVGSSGSDYPANGRWYAASTWRPMGIGLLVTGSGGTGEGNPTEARWQTDCNLVLYRRGDPYWSTDTAKYKNGICYLAMQRDGNLVIYGDNQQPLWASNSGNREDAEYYVQIQLDGNLVIYTPSGDPIWASGTDNWG